MNGTDLDCGASHRSRLRTIDTTIDQQVAMDEALVPHAKRLRIGRSNFCLLSNIKSKESTLQLVYDVLRLCPFFKAFLVTIDVLEIYTQELWVTATVHHHSIRFKMNNKKHIVNLESFREMLHICPRLPHQPFVTPPFEEEILAFLWFLGYSGVIRKLTDVNINKLHQPWRSFAAIINKCLIEKSSGYDSLRLSQAQILFNTKIQRRAMICIILDSRRLSSTISCQRILLFQGGTRNSNAYQEYYAVATGVTPPKPKASVRKTRSSSDTTITPQTAAADDGTGSIPRVPDVPTDESKEELSWNSTYEEGDDGEDDEEDEGGDDEQASDEKEFIHPSTDSEEEIRDEESFDPIPKTPKNSDDKGNGEENLDLNVGREEGHDEEKEEDELYRDVNINQGRGIQMTKEVKDSYVTLTSVNPDGMESIFETTLQMDAHTLTSVAPLPMYAPTITSSTNRMNEAVQVAVQLPSDWLREEAQKENDEFLKTIYENMQKIIKEQVKEQVKTSYVVAVDLSEMELKKILIEKMEGNKSIHRSNEQRNLYKALVEAYESDKIILDTYGDTVTLKRHRDDDADKDEEPSAGPDRGSKRHREGKELESTSAL
nr:hypothetical protein [Tanacetum cinerariifolium]